MDQFCQLRKTCRRSRKEDDRTLDVRTGRKSRGILDSSDSEYRSRN